ncbi:serine hydrolase [Tenacibaculum singaporense]|uniref:Tetratricopeptide repeat protein n=1 Tax=Tenacibaculum singaporense TaxID=2358479 RepID=A0A3S8R6Q1_9FLAO|nr:serine hydrolase [Tenacibaculum singaporense]AZJ35434.1 tetratricopeptide repeat protein [Tenacibaculum singaporense]
MKRLAYLLVLIITFSCTNKKPTTFKSLKITQIANYLDSLDGFSGAVLIAKNDSIIFKKAYGYAHIGHKVKNNTKTKFSYASIGKSFTAVAIFQLIQEGKLSLQDNIGKYLPNYANKVARDSVTIELLLKHRSGLPNYFHSEKFLNTSKEQFRTMESLTNLYENEPLEFKPNQQFAYRNTNYIILGRIIEAITKIPYEKYIEEHIFSIANMKNTGNYDIDLTIENAAENYTLSDLFPNQLQKTIFMGSVKGSPAGGGYSNVDDLYQFSKAFKNNKLLDTKYTNMMKNNPKNDWYGYGMQFAGAKNSGIYGHSGGHYGTGAEWRIFEKQNYTVILLTNKDLDQGFFDARFFIEKTISGTTPKLDNYFFTKDVAKICLNQGLQQAKKVVKNSNFKLSQINLNAKGYEMIKRGFYKKAIDLFTLEVFSFPESYDAYDSLGEAYMKNGQIRKAIKNYQKSLEINPENLNGKEKLGKLLAMNN